MFERGFIHIYFGTGKGKTTAALGLAIRAAGCGKKVIVVQFLKDWNCGEIESLSRLENITIIKSSPFGGKFVFDMTDDEKLALKANQDECLRKALDMQLNGLCDLLVLDESVDAYQLGVLDKIVFEDLLRNKPDALELVITGHKPETWMLENADYTTEMVKHKHPFDDGINARRGIEF